MSEQGRGENKRLKRWKKWENQEKQKKTKKLLISDCYERKASQNLQRRVNKFNVFV